ncbi:F-box protein CPR1-like [Fagus crenata]
MEKNEKQRNRSLSNLPLDVIGNILSKLPVKCLLQWRCVCRAWRDLISDPQFAKSHVEHFIIQETLMLIERSTYVVHYDMLNGVVEDLDCPVTPCFPYVWLNIVGSCNGLLCINPCIYPKNNGLVLWNPSTRELRELPGTPIEFPTRSHKCLSTLYGFGYDSFADDYKLVRVVAFATESYETEVKLYSLRTNSWKRIEDFPYSVPNKCHGIFVSGALHWLVSSEDDLVCTYFVTSLDLAEEKYGLLQLPDYESGQSYCEIGVLGGCLCMYRFVSDITFEVWFMREYGMIESWTKFSITVPHITGLENFVHVKPLCCTENGQIILRVGRKKLVMYSPKEELFRYLLFHGMSEHSVAVTYVESLVSPYNFNVLGR